MNVLYLPNSIYSELTALNVEGSVHWNGIQVIVTLITTVIKVIFD